MANKTSQKDEVAKEATCIKIERDSEGAGLQLSLCVQDDSQPGGERPLLLKLDMHELFSALFEDVAVDSEIQKRKIDLLEKIVSKLHPI